MNSWYKRAYQQFLNTGDNGFIESPRELDSCSGIYISYNSGNFDSLIPSEHMSYSGINIPFFKNSAIFANPVVIGQFLSTVGPGINIGEFNVIDSPSYLRRTGERGEVIIGGVNFIESGIQNIAIGNFNRITKSKQMNVLGEDNYVDCCRYTYILGAYNSLSGIFLSNILGKNNRLYAINDIRGLSPADPTVFSGYETRLININGDYNLIISGGASETIVGNSNNLTNSSCNYIYGNFNSMRSTTGDYNLALGDKNNVYDCINISMIGNQNLSEQSYQDFIFGRSNRTEYSSLNFVYGYANAILGGSSNAVVGNSNEIVGSFNQVFGNNTINFENSVNSTIIGYNNQLSGDYNNYILGSNSTANATILLEAIQDFPYLTGILNRTTGFAGDYNYYIGNNNRNTANDYSFVLGESNNSIDNFKSFVIGSDNKSASNTNSYILGNSNQITGSSNSIFLGFNFVSGTSAQGISGFGIKISPSGIDIYGTLRVNGAVMNIP